MSILVNDQAQVQVSVPYKTSFSAIHAFLNEKFHWIEKCVLAAQKQQAVLAQKDYCHGSEFLFLGKKFPLLVKTSSVKRAHMDFDGQRWEVTLAKEGSSQPRDIIRDQLKKWYKSQAQEILGSKVFQFSRQIDVSPKKIQIRNQKRLWGCCDYHQQSITLNWQIILAPMEVVDYVVIHELCHLIHPNHSQRFWRKVGQYMPHYKEPETWLKKNQIELMLPS